MRLLCRPCMILSSSSSWKLQFYTKTFSAYPRRSFETTSKHKYAYMYNLIWYSKENFKDIRLVCRVCIMSSLSENLQCYKNKSTQFLPFLNSKSCIMLVEVRGERLLALRSLPWCKPSTSGDLQRFLRQIYTYSGRSMVINYTHNIKCYINLCVLRTTIGAVSLDASANRKFVTWMLGIMKTSIVIYWAQGILLWNARVRFK